MKGVIPEERENWKDRQEEGGRICERKKDTEGGKDRKSKCRKSGCFKKHLGAIRERREKRWTQLKLSAPSATLLAYLPASYPTNTFPQKTQRRGGRIQSVREQRESLSPERSHSSQTTASAVKSGPCIVNKWDSSAFNSLQNVSRKRHSDTQRAVSEIHLKL